MVRNYMVIFFLLIACSTLFAQTSKKAAIISVKDDISEHSGDTALKNKLVALGFEVVSYRDGDLDAGQIGEEAPDQREGLGFVRRHVVDYAVCRVDLPPPQLLALDAA